MLSVDTDVLEECLATPNMADIDSKGENLFPERDVGRRANCWEVQIPNKLQQWLHLSGRKDGIGAGFSQVA